MIVEGLVIKEVEGFGQRLLDQKGQVNAFLGISLSRENFFSKKHIGMYFDWALEYCGNFLLVIDDYEERNNYMVFRGMEANVATTSALKRGEDMERAFNKVLLKYEPVDRGRIRIARTAGFFEKPKCQEITHRLSAAFQEDPQFRDDIHAQVLTNIGSRVKEWRETVSDDAYEQGLVTVAQYLLEEVSVTVFMREEMGYPIEVYPGPSMRVVRNLYQGGYTVLRDSLGLKADYGYVYLDIESVEERV